MADPVPTENSVVASWVSQDPLDSASMRVSEVRGLRASLLGEEVRNHLQAQVHAKSMWRSRSADTSTFAVRASRKASPNTPIARGARLVVQSVAALRLHT